jgi:hypothetical protein
VTVGRQAAVLQNLGADYLSLANSGFNVVVSGGAAISFTGVIAVAGHMRVMILLPTP